MIGFFALAVSHLYPLGVYFLVLFAPKSIYFYYFCITPLKRLPLLL